MADMLVKLYDLPDAGPAYARCEQAGVRIHRALSPDWELVMDFVRSQFGAPACGECQKSFSNRPISCFVASRGKKVIGFACYDATAPDFFGPTCVLEEEQGKGIGKALLLRSLEAMRESGYGYAVIGDVGPVEFYQKAVGAIVIPGSAPGIYRDFLSAGGN